MSHLPSSVCLHEHSLGSIIHRDDDVALRQSCKEHFLLPSSEASRAFLSPILADAVIAGAIRCAGAVLLHGADPDFHVTEHGCASVLQVAASQRNNEMVSDRDSEFILAQFSADKVTTAVWCR
jgi:hypothetical protein